MIPLLFLLACTSGEDSEALKSQVKSLREMVGDQALEIEELKVRLTALESRPRSSGGDDADALDHEGPHCTGEGDHLVLPPLNELTPDIVARGVHIIPHKGPTGELDGYRLSGIRRGSLLNSCGVQNGDIVHSMNGMSLLSVDEALLAFKAAPAQKTLSFQLKRRNAPMELTLFVGDGEQLP